MRFVWRIGFAPWARVVAGLVVLVALGWPVGPLVDAVIADRYLAAAFDYNRATPGDRVDVDMLKRAVNLNSRQDEVLSDAGRTLGIAASWASTIDERRRYLEESVRLYSIAIQRERT